MLEAYGLYTHVRSNRIKTGIALVIFPILLPLIIFCVGLAIGFVGGHPTHQVIGASGAYSIIASFVVVPLMIIWVPIGYLIPFPYQSDLAM